MEQVRKFECEECEEILTSHSRFIQHSLSHIGVTVLCCENCEKLFHHEKELEQHTCLQTHHENHEYSECGTPCTTKSDLTEHANICSETESFKCDECGKLFYDKSHLAQHRSTHSLRRVRKDDCEKMLYDKSHLAQHKSPHSVRVVKKDMNPQTKTGKHTCHECNKTFTSKSTLIVHMGIHTETECDEYDKASTSINYFGRPLLTQSLKNLYKCSECNELFSQKKYLAQHVRIHTGGKRCACEKCGKTFSERIGLIRHMKIHIGEKQRGGKQYKCDECNKTFTRENSLIQHKYVHIGRNQYTCDKCGKTLGNKTTLINHMKTHSTEKCRWEERTRQVKMRKVVPARRVGPECTDGCFRKVGRDNINAIFSNFWAIGDCNARNAYLQDLIREVPVKWRQNSAADNQRDVLYNYFVRVQQREIEVCQFAFHSIHGFSKQKVSRLLNMRKSPPSDTLVSDRKDHNLCNGGVAWNTLERIHKHIRSLPVTASQQSRAYSPLKRYLASGGSITDLHCDYLLWMRDYYPNEEIVSLGLYTTVFAKNYNIVFQPPKTDMCVTCKEYQMEISNLDKRGCDTAEVEEALRAHKAIAQVPLDLIHQSEENAPGEVDGDLRTVAIDLQQTLPCPLFQANMAYCKQKLWVYNFCIYDLCRQKANLFVWDEVTGGKGADEVASCLLKWLQSCQDHGDVFRKLRVYCDNCFSQNKNIFVLLMALQLVHASRLIRVELVFMKSCHSYLPCDRAFSSIEKRIREQAFIHSTQHYVELISTAVKKGFLVVNMVREDFLDMHVLLKHVTECTVPEFAQACQFVIDVEYPEGYIIKDNYSPSDIGNIKKVQLMKGKGHWQKETFDLSKVTLSPKYPRERLLAPEKVTDLRSQLHLLDSLPRQWLEDLCNKQDELRWEGEVQVSKEEPVDDPDNTTLDYCPLIVATLITSHHMQC